MSDREKFSTEELMIVMSNYDIGPITGIKDFPRGSRRAPKLVVTSEKGEYLLKRRARGKDDPFKVAFSHALQLYLASRQFPLPHLIGTRKDNNSMLQHNNSVYELFEYIRGDSYDSSLEATFDAGKTLALYHKLLREYTPEFEPPVGSYHSSRVIHNSLEQLPNTLDDPARGGAGARASEDQVDATTGFLRKAYFQAAEKVEAAGLSQWPVQIVHCDWHPGNMLFRHRKVVAVIDYDAARLQQRVIDVANGALQFSMIATGEDPAQWPDFLDKTRFKRFIRGYDEVDPVSVAELQAIPWLMVEAMVAESVLPVAATGSFGKLEGYGFLQMIERKVRWTQANADELIAVVAH
jgi:Ser/Thr protein kinase RdoA (MazF antagonist)